VVGGFGFACATLALGIVGPLWLALQATGKGRRESAVAAWLAYTESEPNCHIEKLEGEINMLGWKYENLVQAKSQSLFQLTCALRPTDLRR
jgi:hypothetical protein